MTDKKPKITAIEIFPKPEGTDFGQELAVEVKCSDNYEGRVDLRLCFKFNGSKGDAGGNTSVTIKNGIGKIGVRIPLHPGWDEHPAEKNKRPLIEYWFEGNIAWENEKFIGTKLKVPTLESRQDFHFQFLDSGDYANVEVIGKNGQEACKATRITPYGNISGDKILVDTTKAVSFYTSKPATDNFAIHVEDKRQVFGKPIPMVIPPEFLEKGETVYLLHSFLNPTGFMDSALNTNSGYSNTSMRISPVLSPVQLPGYFEEDDPIIIMDLKYNNPKSTGMKEGENSVAGITEAGRKLLIETIFGDDIVPGAIAVKENMPMIKDFIKGDKFYIKTVNGKDYVIFKGWGALRKIYKGSRYRLQNSKVVSLSACKGWGSAIKAGVRGSTGSWISLVFVCSMDIVEWMQQQEGQRFFSDVLIQLASSTSKALIGTIASALAMATGALILGSSAPVIAVIIGGVAVGIIVGAGLTILDNRYKITEKAKENGQKCSRELSTLFEYVVVQPFTYFLYRLENEILSLYKPIRPY